MKTITLELSRHLRLIFQIYFNATSQAFVEKIEGDLKMTACRTISAGTQSGLEIFPVLREVTARTSSQSSPA